MASNSNLGAAKSAKNDEFYTQYVDIEREMNAYLDFNPDVFRGKTLLLPCDDPEWSNFTLYFAQNFQSLGLKKLISTSYAQESKKFKKPYQPSLFEQEAPQYNPTMSQTHGKIFVIDRDIDGDGRIDIHDIQYQYLEGDGDFRSEEVTRLRDEADIIVTNPPFSLFREFIAWVIAGGKQFSIIGNMNAVTYKEVFPLIKENKMWLGKADVRWFHGGAINAPLFEAAHSRWYTNLEHGRRHEPLQLMTMADNLKFSRHKELRGKSAYDHYDNYDAIEVPFTDAIPDDYYGVMGVPISFLDKYCPEQFMILGITQRNDDPYKKKKYTKEEFINANDLNCRAVIMKDGVPTPMYARLLIEAIKSGGVIDWLSMLYIDGFAKYDRPYLNGERLYARLLIIRIPQKNIINE